MNNGITILVCTYNGASRLPQTIAHLAKQQLNPGIGCEVIIIDNASTDNSAMIAREEWLKHRSSSISFEILTDQRPGKIHALETGIAHSKYEFFVICDDDNWLAPHYAQTVYSILQKDENIGAVGGWSEAVTESILPEWFKAHQANYAVGEQGTQTSDITARGFLWGAGLGSRVSLYKKMYKDYPSLLVGREGEKMTAGEDSEYCHRLVLAGYKLWYCDDLFFKHFIPAGRLTMAYLDKLIEGLKRSDEVLDKYRLAARIKDKYEGRPFRKLKSIIGTSLGTLVNRSQEKSIIKKNKLQLLLPFDNGDDKIISIIRKISKY